MSEANDWLRDLRVVDLGLGMAPGLVAKFLAESGAQITRVEPPTGDPFYDLYPAYRVWHRGARIDADAAKSPQRLNELLAAADVCIVGGEDYPGVSWRRDAAALQAQHPRLVVLDIQGYPAGSKHAGRPATDLLVQARSGLSNEHYADRPMLMSFEPSNYGAALHGLSGLFAALIHREHTGRGQVVATSLYEGAIGWTMLLWCEGEKPTPGFSFVMPKSPTPLIFKCADGVYVQVLLGSTGSKYLLYKVLGINDPTVKENDSGMPKPTADTRNFFGDVDLLQAHVEPRQSQELLEAIWKVGLPAEPVLPPGRVWDDPQTIHNKIIDRDTDGTRRVGHPLEARFQGAGEQEPAPAGKGPLSGLRVVDFGAFVAGPYTSVLLADLGADVVKVEAMTGDPNRSIFRSYGSVNRGKRAIKLDMKTPEGREIAQRLCVQSDVITSNFRPGVSARLGIDAKTLHAKNPSLIVLESAAYGTSGPRSEGAGFDMCFQALCGHDYRAGGVGNAPLWNRTSMVDYAGGLLGAVASLRHLYHRTRTGEGAELGAGLLNAAIYLLSELVQRPDGTFAGAPLLNREQTGYHPAEQMYEAADGWIAIAARGESAAGKLVEVLGLTGSIKQPRAQWGDAEARAIAGAVKTRNVADLSNALEQAGVWAELCRKDVELPTLNDPQLLAQGTIYRSVHPQFGEVKQVGPLFRFSESPNSAQGHAALPGEHTRAVLGELGYTAAEIDSFYERKIVA